MWSRLLFFLLTAICFTDTTGAVTPQWHYDDYPCRILFTCADSTNGCALLSFYHADTGFETDAVRIAAPANSNLPWRLLDKTADRTLILVKLDKATPRPVQVLAYAAPAGVPRADHAPSLEAEYPIAVSSFARGKRLPTALPHLLYMLQNNPRQGRTQPLASFPTSLTRDDKSAVMQFRTFVSCPRAGLYRFQATGPDHAFLFLDGAVGSEVQGPAVTAIRLLTTAGPGQAPLTLEWQPPGETAFQPIPRSAFTAPSLAGIQKVERRDRTLQPQFDAEPLVPYAFRSLSPIFYPVRLTDRSENWLPHPLSPLWLFPNGETNANPKVLQTFTNNGPHTVTLSVHDELGFINSVSHVVAWDNLIPKQYRLAALPFPMPAAWFRSDTLEPALMTQGDWPAEYNLQLTARLRRLNGDEEIRTLAIAPTHTPVSHGLAACPAGEFDRLDWSISHLGVTLTNGSFTVLHPPYPTNGIRLAIDRLTDETGRQVVYVAPRLPAPPQPPAATSNSPVLLIDDFITARAAPDPSGRPEAFAQFLGEASGEPVRILPLSDWRDPADAWRPLLKLVEVPQLAGPKPARLLLALGGQDCAAGLAAESFERQAAVLSDRLQQAGHAVIWVTSPPFPERPEKSRLYAGAIRRVAESRGLPVVDLYSLFAGATPGGRILFDPTQPDCLSTQGRKLAAERIAEVLPLQTQGAPPEP
ncbi:MAG: hypothetical protein R6X19_02150 [Kiritimatiellia bacterium]